MYEEGRESYIQASSALFPGAVPYNSSLWPLTAVAAMPPPDLHALAKLVMCPTITLALFQLHLSSLPFSSSLSPFIAS